MHVGESLSLKHTGYRQSFQQGTKTVDPFETRNRSIVRHPLRQMTTSPELINYENLFTFVVHHTV